MEITEISALKNHVTNLFEEMDKASKKFSEEEKISCPPQCGQCCYSPEVEASVLEMLPWAHNVLNLGHDEALTVLEKLKDAIKSGTKICQLFSLKTEKCLAYEFRPTICRLFGYMGIQNRYGETKVSYCKYLKPQHSHHQSTPPVITVYFRKIQSLSPNLDMTQPIPINEAMALALEKILMHHCYLMMS
jgi:Fe-S-cluster containining protein